MLGLIWIQPVHHAGIERFLRNILKRIRRLQKACQITHHAKMAEPFLHVLAQICKVNAVFLWIQPVQHSSIESFCEIFLKRIHRLQKACQITHHAKMAELYGIS